jgi:hypothetical protein
MKMKRGKGDMKMPPIGLMQTAVIVRENCYPLHLVRPNEIRVRRAQDAKEVLGMPVMFALSEDYKTGMLYPAPDEDGEILLRFYPPMIEV